jgi:hypothetical protein
MKFMKWIRGLGEKKAKGPKVSHFERPPMAAPVIPVARRTQKKTKAVRIPSKIKRARKKARRMRKLPACRPTY